MEEDKREKHETEDANEETVEPVEDGQGNEGLFDGRVEREQEGKETDQELGVDVDKEHASVSLGHAVADPRAVVVVGHHTSFAGSAVLGPQGLLELANCAVLHLDENWSGVLIGLPLLSHIDINRYLGVVEGVGN